MSVLRIYIFRIEWSNDKFASGSCLHFGLTAAASWEGEDSSHAKLL